MTLKWVEIFKSGTRTSSNGITRKYTPDELDQVVQTYDPSHFKAPLIVSYPAHNTDGFSDQELWKSQLAFGFPDRLKRVGDRLVAGFRQISPKVKEWIQNGQILGFSASFYLPDSPFNPYPGNLALRHVAGCGIDPPAVKGMTPPELSEPIASFADYAEDQEGSVEFSMEVERDQFDDVRLGLQIYRAIKAIDASFAEFGDLYTPNPIAALTAGLMDWFTRLRERHIEQKSVEDADKLYPPEMLDILGNLQLNSSTPLATLDDIGMIQSQIQKLMWHEKGDDEESTDGNYQYSDGGNGKMNKLKKMMAGAMKKKGMDYAALASMLDMKEADLRMAMEEEAADMSENENAILKGRIAKLEQERENERVSSFVDGLVRDRKLHPDERIKTVRFILNQPNDSIADYGEDGEISPRQAYMNLLAGRKPLFSDRKLPIGAEHAPGNFSDFTAEYGEGYDAESIKVDRAIRAHCLATGKDPNIVEHYEGAWNDLIRAGKLSGSF